MHFLSTCLPLVLIVLNKGFAIFFSLAYFFQCSFHPTNVMGVLGPIFLHVSTFPSQLHSNPARKSGSSIFQHSIRNHLARALSHNFLPSID